MSIEGRMVVLKSMVCMVISHKWSRHRYPVTQGHDQPEGTYLRCLRCGRIDESEPGPSGPMAAGFG